MAGDSGEAAVEVSGQRHPDAGNFGVVDLPRRTLVNEIALSVMPDALASACRFRKRFGRWPAWRRRDTFSAQMYHLGRTGLPGLRPLVDKAQARIHAAGIVGPESVPLRHLLTADPVLPWDELPDRLAISATHGSGMTMVIGDTPALDRPRAEEIFASWLRRDYARHMREPIYRGIVPQLIVEENLADAAGEPPVDYKFFCFAGEPVFVQAVSGRFHDRRMACFDLDWLPLPFSIGKPPAALPRLPRPVLLDEMVTAARKLASGFAFVRVDLYGLCSGRVVFGEFTFVPCGGHFTIVPDAWDVRLGRLFDAAREGVKPSGLPAL